MRDKILTGLSRFISMALNPLLMPTYACFLVLWVSVLCAQPVGGRAMVLVVVACLTCMIPMMTVGTLHHFHFVRDKQLNSARERRIPYVVTLVCLLPRRSLCTIITRRCGSRWCRWAWRCRACCLAW